MPKEAPRHYDLVPGAPRNALAPFDHRHGEVLASLAVPSKWIMHATPNGRSLAGRSRLQLGPPSVWSPASPTPRKWLQLALPHKGRPQAQSVLSRVDN